MPVFSMQRRVKAHEDVVWKIISDVGGLADVAPHVSRVEVLGGSKVGLRRRVYDRRGLSWIETCVAWEDGSHYTMEVDPSEYPFPYKALQATFRLTREATTVLVSVELDYEPKYGVIGAVIDRIRLTPGFKRICGGLMDDWVKQIYQREWVYQVTVRSIIDNKGDDLFSVKPDTPILETGRLLRERHIGSAIVLNDEGGVEGVVSERDIVRGIAVIGADLLEHPVKDIMTRNVVTCDMDDDMVTVMALMTHRRIRHLPVMDDGKLVSVISIGDVVKLRMDQLEMESATLREYIEARRWKELTLRFGPGAHDQPHDPHATPIGA